MERIQTKNTARRFCLPCVAARYGYMQVRRTLGQEDLYLLSTACGSSGTSTCILSPGPGGAWEPGHCSVLAGPGFGC